MLRLLRKKIFEIVLRFFLIVTTFSCKLNPNDNVIATIHDNNKIEIGTIPQYRFFIDCDGIALINTSPILKVIIPPKPTAAINAVAFISL
jgi:hypothetical protein